MGTGRQLRAQQNGDGAHYINRMPWLRKKSPFRHVTNTMDPYLESLRHAYYIGVNSPSLVPLSIDEILLLNNETLKNRNRPTVTHLFLFRIEDDIQGVFLIKRLLQIAEKLPLFQGITLIDDKSTELERLYIPAAYIAGFLLRYDSYEGSIDLKNFPAILWEAIHKTVTTVPSVSYECVD